MEIELELFIVFMTTLFLGIATNFLVALFCTVWFFIVIKVIQLKKENKL